MSNLLLKHEISEQRIITLDKCIFISADYYFCVCHSPFYTDILVRKWIQYKVKVVIINVQFWVAFSRAMKDI